MKPGNEFDEKLEGNIRQAPGFSKYLISDLGLVYDIRGRRMIGTINAKGYYCVSVSNDNGKRRTMRVHRLVGLAFGLIGENDHINHIDGVKTNNKLSNLEKTTPIENNRHAFRIGLNRVRKGEEHNSAKLTAKDVERIRFLRFEADLTTYQIAACFELSTKHVSDICENRRWKQE